MYLHCTYVQIQTKLTVSFKCCESSDMYVHGVSTSIPLQKYVQMSALDDKDVPSAEQWKDAVAFMTSALSRQIKQAESDLEQLTGPASFYDRWLMWKSQSSQQVRSIAITPCTYVRVHV